MKLVIALGGNALGDTPEKQKEMVKETAKHILPLIEQGHNIILTHGNGPQVGLINLAFEEGKKVNSKVCPMPFCECGAMSQGYIGFHLQNALQNELNSKGIDKKVITLVTQIEVDENDTAFLNPTKPIGSFYTKEEIANLDFPVKEDAGRGYRRVIASPKPQKIIEQDMINSLSDNGYIVITCGGGGIPVINKNGTLIGTDAVIDKDFASSKLASDINADVLLILTAVDDVSINYKQPDEIHLHNVTVSEVEEYNRQGHFHAGSMKPKVEASINFVVSGNNRTAIITSIEKVSDALKGLAGTKISA